MTQSAVNSAIQVLSSLLLQEIKLLGSAKQGVQDIKRELESIRSLLKDADIRAAQEEEEGAGSSEGVKTIEDAVDEYTMRAARLPHGRGLIGCIHKACYFIKMLKLGHGIATEIKDIKLSLAEIQRVSICPRNQSCCRFQGIVSCICIFHNSYENKE